MLLAWRCDEGWDCPECPVSGSRARRTAQEPGSLVSGTRRHYLGSLLCGHRAYSDHIATEWLHCLIPRGKAAHPCVLKATCTASPGALAKGRVKLCILSCWGCLFRSLLPLWHAKIPMQGDNRLPGVHSVLRLSVLAEAALGGQGPRAHSVAGGGAAAFPGRGGQARDQPSAAGGCCPVHLALGTAGSVRW